MFLSQEIVIPANTAIATPATFTIRVLQSTVRRVWVRWRWGSGGLCGVRMLYNGFQYWPLSLGQWFPSNIVPLEFEEGIPLDEPPFDITAIAYNLDDTFSHKCWLAFLLERPGNMTDLTEFLQFIAKGG